MKSDSRFAALFERWYLPFILTLWSVAPGIRRLSDWQFGRNPFNVVSVLPMLCLVPLAWVVYRSATSANVKLPFKALCYFWLFGFVYGLVVALASGGRAGALYDFAQFCLPLLFGAWIVMRPASRKQTFAQLTSTLLWLAAIESIYGIYQFIAPPPWDVKYVNDLNQISLGIAEPFGLHPFSLLNSHGMLSVFLAAVCLLNLHKLDIRRPWPLVVILLSVTVIMLTNARSSWIALAIGVVTYVVLSRKRGQALLALGAVGIFSAVFLFNASVLFGNSDVTNQLQARFTTLTNVDEDASVNGRRDESSFALHQGLAEPLGQGLGTVGTSVWLEGNQDDSKASSLVLDNGYIARFLEMGIPGAIAYLATIVFSVVFSLRALALALARNDVVLENIAIAALCVQAALIGLDLSSDWHSAFAGVFFWAIVGLTLRYEPGDDDVRSAMEVTQPAAASTKRPIWA